VPIAPIAWIADGVRILDQTRLPTEEHYLDLRSIDEVAESICMLRVRGAPLIGIAAAMGLAAAAGTAARRGILSSGWLDDGARQLEETRPTAVNLRWALDRMRLTARSAFQGNREQQHIADLLHDEAQRIWDIESGMCVAIGEAGAELLASGFTVLTHCNAGALATGGLGTALAVIYVASEQGKGIDVVATETRPLRQGARLTAWELAKAGIPARVIVDSAAASLMARGEIDVVLTGADRIAANGDVANKIGTYALAVLANAHGIPFYVAAPRSTFDLTLASGDQIPIEERSAEELPAASGVAVYNPAFDVTPAQLVQAIVTDKGVVRHPLLDGINEMFG
jgi:methylthioribose-1-phosphate isomerase